MRRRKEYTIYEGLMALGGVGVIAAIAGVLYGAWHFIAKI